MSTYFDITTIQLSLIVTATGKETCASLFIIISCHLCRLIGFKNFLLSRVLQYQNGTQLFNSLSFNKIIGYLEYRHQNFVLEHRGFLENVNVKRTSRLLDKQ